MRKLLLKNKTKPQLRRRNNLRKIRRLRNNRTRIINQKTKIKSPQLKSTMDL
jgi:hypothetical protein